MPDKRVQAAISFLKLTKTAYHDQDEREEEDLRFQVPSNAWSAEAQAARAATTVNGVPIPARPMLSLATLDEPLQLVENQYRDAHLGVNIHPLSPDASDDTAQVLQGIYRTIEVHSRASAIPRAWGFSRALRGGRGFYRILSEYDPDTGVPGDQRLVIKRILFQDSVKMDPFAEEPDWSDGEQAAILSDIPKSTYDRKYKKSALANYDDSQLIALGRDVPDWVNGTEPESRTVRVCEHFYVEHESEPVTVPKGGADGSDLTFNYDKRIVKWCKVNAVEVLDEGEWPGPYIPIIPCIGKELQPFDGKRRWAGMISNAKDGVRLVNYAASGAVEMAALEPKAPWMMEEGQDANFEWEYQQANIRNFPVLHYRSRNSEGQPVKGPPQRVQVDASRLGPNMALLSMGKDFVQSATQTFEPALGKQTPAHRSGEAIKALQGQTVEGTSNYIGNLADISMTLEAKIMLAAIPHFYDRPGRIVQIMDGEDRAKPVILNQPFQYHPQTGQPQQAMVPDPNNPMQPVPMPADHAAIDQKQVYHYDLKKGLYGVTVTVGKSYQSKLQEGNDMMGQLLMEEPSWLPILGPNWIKYQDWPGHAAAADMLKKVRDHQFPYLADDPQAQAMDPQKLLAENQQLKQQLQAAGMVIQTKQVETQSKIAVATIQENAETARADKDREAKMAVAALQGKFETMQNAMQLLQQEIARIGSQQHEAAMAAGDHQSAIIQAAQGAQQDATQSDQEHGQALVQNAQQAALAPSPQPPQGNGQAQ